MPPKVRPPKVGLVLGAGGTVGMAYHAGALRALERVSGFSPKAADVLVGTSAGAVAGAYLRSGWSTEDFWRLAIGTHPRVEAMSAEEIADSRQAIMAPMTGNPFDLMRRAIGSAWVLSRSVIRVPIPRVPAALSRAFPGGMFAMAEGRRRFADELPVGWPKRALWLCAVDISSGRRVVLGRGHEPLCSLQDAVAASCAIPGVYPPVRIGRYTLVDGGAHSPSNLDLAARESCDLIVAVAPMAYDTSRPPASWAQFIRRVPSRLLAAESALARRSGAEVLLIRPSAAEVRLHGTNLMRRSGWDQVARAAYEATARALETDRFRRSLSALGA